MQHHRHDTYAVERRNGQSRQLHSTGSGRTNADAFERIEQCHFLRTIYPDDQSL